MEDIRAYKLDDVLDFGEFIGRTVESVAKDHPDYFLQILHEANSFIISRKDLESLQQKYPSLCINDIRCSYINKKIEVVEHREFRAIFNENMSHWLNVKESPRSKIQRDRYPSDLSLYVRLDYNKDSHVTLDKHTWKFVVFGVDADASPMIEVYCYSVKALSRYAITSMDIKDTRIHYFKFSLNMNDFDFGYLARTLEEMRMIIRE